MMRLTLKCLLVFVLLASVGFAAEDSFAETRKKAEAGDAEAQNRLGVIYQTGDKDTPVDPVEAVKWYRMAAEQGFDTSQFNLGGMYIKGSGVQKDSTEAIKWLRKCAEGNGAAYHLLPLLFEDFEKSFPQERAEYAVLVRMVAEKGKMIGQQMLGILYYRGDGVPKDKTEAINWWLKAALQGGTSAQELLGLAYSFGDGVPKDYAEAIKWFRMAAEKGKASAQYNLGLMYAEGFGVPKDLVQAHVWLNIAGAQAHEDAKKYLAIAEEEMTPEQKAEAMKLAKELWQKLPKK